MEIIPKLLHLLKFLVNAPQTGSQSEARPLESIM
jgi:hypothetical protein